MKAKAPNPERSVQEVKSVQLMGTNVMVGIHANGSEELRLWNSSPINSETASDMDPRVWGGDL